MNTCRKICTFFAALAVASALSVVEIRFKDTAAGATEQVAGIPKLPQTEVYRLVMPGAGKTKLARYVTVDADCWVVYGPFGMGLDCDDLR